MTMLTKSAGLADLACRSGTGPEGASHGGQGSDQSQHRPGGPGEGDRGVPGRRRRRRIRAAVHGLPGLFNAKQLDQGGLLPNAELAGSVQLWEWIGDEGAATLSY